jgi:2-amino-1-hydroxyethylphosphonate dioxygenase (glycine-forming)
MTLSQTSPSATADHLLSMYEKLGNGDYIGEHISQLEHSLQAAHLAATSGSDNETILAALFHDIGQFLPANEVRALARSVQDMRMSVDGADSVGRVGHETIGAEYLARWGFSRKIQTLVGAHVAAKRYLVAVDPSYADELSDASKASLKFQGGPMNEEERKEFEADGWYKDKCALRKWDDGAKVVGLEVAPLETYRGMIEKHLEQPI